MILGLEADSFKASNLPFLLSLCRAVFLASHFIFTASFNLLLLKNKFKCSDNVDPFWLWDRLKNIHFHHEMATKMSMNSHVCVKASDSFSYFSVVISAVWHPVTSHPQIYFLLVAVMTDFFKTVTLVVDMCAWAPWIKRGLSLSLFYNLFRTLCRFSLRQLLCDTWGPWILQENRITRNTNSSIIFLWSQTVQRDQIMR